MNTLGALFDLDAFNEQVEYGQFGFDSSIEQISTLDTLIPFKTKVGNIDLNSDGTITLKANKIPLKFKLVHFLDIF